MAFCLFMVRTKISATNLTSSEMTLPYAGRMAALRRSPSCRSDPALRHICRMTEQ